MSSITITDARVARKFICKHSASRKKVFDARHGYMSDDECVEFANRMIAALPEKWLGKTREQRAARMLMDVKAKNRDISTTCRCSECGTRLSAPESVAAGIGPECQMNLATAHTNEGY